MIGLKLKENANEFIKTMEEFRNGTRQEVDKKNKEIEGYVQMIHTQVMHDLSSWQDCHKMYLQASQRFDSRLNVVQSLEKNFQQVLTFIKSMQEMIS